MGDRWMYVISFNDKLEGGRFSLSPECSKKEKVVGKIKIEDIENGDTRSESESES